MNEKRKLLSELDAAIDALDLDGVDRALDALSAVSDPVAAEEPPLFSARVKKMHKERSTMRTTSKPIKLAIITAVVAALGITVYATGALNVFSFGSGDRFYSMRTTQEMTEEEARDMALETNPDESRQSDEAFQADVQEYDFKSVEEALATLDMEIPLPAAMPDMALESASAQVADFGDAVKSLSLWLNYGDEDGRLFGVTIVRYTMSADAGILSDSDMDPGSLGSYTSKSGITYNTLTESDDSGERTAHIATTTVGEYEYTLVFFGFDEAQRAAIIDSADLSSLE